MSVAARSRGRFGAAGLAVVLCVVGMGTATTNASSSRALAAPNSREIPQSRAHSAVAQTTAAVGSFNLLLQGAAYFPESDPIFSRTAPCRLFNFTEFTAAIGGNTDIYGDCGTPSVTWTLTGPGSLAVHQFDNGNAILSVDGVDKLNLSGGCFAGNIQTVDITGAGAHAIRIDRMRDNYAGCQYASWGFDGIEWTGAPPAIPSEPSNSAEPPNTGSGADPVLTFSGAFVYRHADVDIRGRGTTPSITRSYDSLDLRPGPLGPGWKINGQARLRHPEDGSQDLILIGPDGRTDRYINNGDGTFSPPPADLQTLVKNLDGTYTVSNKSHERWNFDNVGRATSIVDRYGNSSTMTYSGNLLTSVSDPAGRGALTFAYTSGLLTSVTDWASPARTVTYQYDGSGRLWKVTDREGHTTTFSYDGSSARITTITDARGHTALTLTYDAQGRVVTQKDARGLTTGDVTTFDYVVNGDGTRVTTITQPVASFEPTFHPTVVDTHDPNGWLTQRVSKPSSTETLTETYTYDANGNRTSVTDPRGNRTDFCYDTDYAGAAIGSRGNLTRTIGPAPTAGANRPVTLLAYDSNDNVIQSVAPMGVPSSPTVTCASDLSAITAAYATDIVYDSSGLDLLSMTSRFTDPDTGLKTATTKYEYGDAANPGLVTRVIPPRGNTTGTPDYTYATTMSYFASGQEAGMLSRSTDALGNVTTYDYDAVGRLTSTVDAIGNAAGGVPADHTTNYVYDKEDRVRFVKLPAPSAGGAQLVTETRYDEDGNPIVRIDANGQVVTYAFDERDGLFQVKESPSAWTDPAAPPTGAITTEYAYDAAGNLIRTTRAKGDAANERATDYAYDGRGLARSETQYPSWPTTTPTLVTTSTFDPDGNPATLVDPLGRTTTSAYDALNRITSVTYSDGVTPPVGYGYDANGNRTSMTDGTGSTSYAYDEANRLTSTTSPGSKTIGYRYDLDGNRIKMVYPDATAVTYTFNKAAEMTGLSDWANRTVSYTFDPDRALKTATNPDTTVASYSYDNAGRLAGITHKLGSTIFDQRAYQFDAVGNVTNDANGSLFPQFARPDGLTGSNGLWSGTFASINETPANDTTFLASPAGPTTSNFYEVSLSDVVGPGSLAGLTLRYRYAKSGDNAGQTTNLAVEIRQGTTIIASQAQTNIPGVTGSGWQQASITLTSAQASAITDFTNLRLRFLPSSSGGGQKRAAQVSWSEFQVPGPGDPTTGSAYTYDRLGRLTSVTGVNGARSYAYDPLGNRTTKIAGGSTSYAYDRADRITAAGSTSIAVNANGNTATRGSDTFTYDQANRLITASVAGVTETYAYGGDGTRFSRQVGAGTPIRYVSDPNGNLPVTIDDGAHKYVYGVGLAYAVSGSTLEVFHTDRLGSVRAITNAAGAVTATFRTDEWGIPTSTTGSSTELFGFTGEPGDATGLVYLRSRYYDPSLGRFLNRDGFSGAQCQSQTQNRYTYAWNGPATRTDPSGENPFSVGPLPGPPPPSGPCLDLAIKMSSFVDGIKQKFDEVVNNVDLPMYPDPNYWSSVFTHQERIQGLINGLDNMEQKWRDLGCPGDPPSLPSEYRAIPEPNNTAPQSGPNAAPFFGLAGAALIAYLIVSEGSRIVFPVRNLVPAP